MFYVDFVQVGVLKNFANFTIKHLCWSHFLIKLQALGQKFSKLLFSKNTSRQVLLFIVSIFCLSAILVFAELMGQGGNF